MTDYLNLDDILDIHADQIARYGGSLGIRDAGLLDAAIFRPQTGYYADLIAEAAALWESLTCNHPFVDGNKRTGFAATYAFLGINGLTIIADWPETFAFIDALFETNGFRFDAIEPWLRAHVR